MHRTTITISDTPPIDAVVTRVETRYLIDAARIRLADGYLPREYTCSFMYYGRQITGIIVKATIERSDWNGDPSVYDLKLEVVADPAR